MKKRTLIFTALCAVLLCIVAFCTVYICDYYPADMAAVEAFAGEICGVRIAKNATVYASDDASSGLIFYPGGKVSADAYAPLMQACAARGITSVLLEMPLRLAVLDSNAAIDIPSMLPEIDKWYIAGHSLGGAMAASCAANSISSFKGIVLLAAYSTADLRNSGLDVLLISGSEDGVLNRDKYAECLAMLPDDYTEVIIPGGCHAGFGMYGKQDGDGAAGIDSSMQISITADEIADFILER